MNLFFVFGVLLASCNAAKYALTCSRDVCNVTLAHGQVVQLFKEQHSLLHTNSVVEYNGVQFPIHNRESTLHPQHYHTSLQTGVFWATAQIDVTNMEIAHGVFTLESGEMMEIHARNKTSVRRRTLRESSTQSRDVVLEDLTTLKQAANDAQLQQQRTVLQTDLGIYQFFPNCFLNDHVTHVFELEVVYDWGLFDSLTNAYITQEEKIQAAIADVESIFSVGKLVFLAQFNVRLEVKRIIFGSRNDKIPLRRSKKEGTCTTAIGAFDEFRVWNAQQPTNTGFRILLSNCFSQITGVSYIGTLCPSNGMNSNVAYHDWFTVFHELGHAFGMSHSFENGQGITGGLMDYGNGYFQGAIQYHPNKMNEACNKLSSINCPAFFYPVAVDSACGDGVLVDKEECECLKPNTTKCGKCVMCKLTTSDVECSSDTFVLRKPGMPSLVIIQDTKHLDDTKCCKNGRFAAPQTLCGKLDLDVCSVGQCVSICSKYLDWQNPVCGFDPTGCSIGCLRNGKCTFDLAMRDETGEWTKANYLPPSTACYLSNDTQSSATVGKCFAGSCYVNVPTQSPAADVGLITASPSSTAITYSNRIAWLVTITVGMVLWQ